MDDRSIESLSNEELRDQLIKHGQQVIGPVVKTTRKVYENKLKKILSGSTPTRRSVGGLLTTRVESSPSTPNDRLNTSSTISSSPWSTGSRNTYGDTRTDQDDDLMEGEESFRYVAPTNESPIPASPYSALGGSMIATPPRKSPPRTTPAATRPDIDYKTTPYTSPPAKPSTYGFTSRLADGSGAYSKSSSISYHTSGGGGGLSSNTEPYRRQVPIATSSSSANVVPARNTSKGFADTRGYWSKMKPWLPLLVKIFLAIVAIVFIGMVIKRAMRSGMGDEGDETFELPA